ncbi:DHA1 family bicyclomycin/chloramphenicol resistance-like MFS transporter [Kordia periserrulae]|uniref:DHA1 family bicyclomycin/chloramphenicol resistance-like MFS transporter n=1 Tax=Kordia periserrulae TaxID=701523 RepID=A0A2T6BZH5_9FLAO|nr:multidrug effflux MFS transporter [Kordia periserrulae]PTX61473.1 DHA1 family bicyclomycin/chloramphenicol resistance-like MFS transporter [Kordia periserrulae]
MISKKQSQTEFILLMASLMSIVALSIDAILPALDVIGNSIGITDDRNNQMLITMIFLGLGFGQLIFGPLSDSMGRKPIIYIGFTVFVLASFICVLAPNLEIMIIGRILQGIGLSAPRTISIAMVRDSFSGDYMAKIMSFIVAIFILVPVVAPALGKLLLDSFGWEAIFNSQLIFGAIIMIWLWKRQPETLHPEHKIKLSKELFINGLKEFMKFKTSIAFTLISGFITGSFMVYLSASQDIFQNQYNLKEEFPYIFAALAISVGFATFLNGTLVLKFGMYKLVRAFLIAFTTIPLIYLLFYFGKPNPNAYVLVAFFAIQFFSIGFLFGNLRSLAMQPVGHIAGVGAAINGFVSTIMAVPIATYIGRFITDTASPLFIGFLICGVTSIGILIMLKKSVTSEAIPRSIK